MATTTVQAGVPLEDLHWIALDDAMPDHPSVRRRRKHLPKATPRHLVNGVVGVLDAVRAGLGVDVVPLLFMLQAEPQPKARPIPLENCASAPWLLAHPESRRLVVQHLAEEVRVPA